MELKRYQRKVLRDIEAFIDQCNEKRNIPKAFRSFWQNKGVEVAEGTDLQPYQSSIKGVPRVTVKVPTAGGKTFIACNALEKMFSTLEVDKPKVVVWFVPSDPILQQTVRRLKDSADPYRQRIDALFNGAVGVYDKEELLNAKGFDPVTVKEQLTIAVLSIDSFAATDKESRRVRRENSELAEFGQDSLMEVLAALNPVVIIDESHNFRSNLRTETLRDINPSFILELTATPRETSNVISFVDAKQLKDEHMVKLPVIVYNQRNKTDLMLNAIQLRNNLEQQAVEAEQKGGKYIRPIVLFQAQPRTSDDSETFDKIKDNLIEIGIPAEQIKIKTAGKDELKGIDLMSRACPVRYIITVNALKEGWDCPFAYILASLANRTSKVDVEQILGRILRLPYTKESDCEFLNMGYVLTSSNDFEQTITGIIDGLQNSGFSAKDYRAVEPEHTNMAPSYSPTKQPSLFDAPEEKAEEVNDPEFDPADVVNVEVAKEVLTKTSDAKKQPETVAEILSAASQQNKDFTQKMEDDAKDDQPTTIPVKAKASNEARIKTHFVDIASSVILPIFEIRQKLTNKVLFDETTDEYVWVKLEKEHLYRGFDISKQDKNIQWNWAASTAVRIDLEQRNENEFVPKSWLLNARQMDAFKSYIATLAPEGKISQLSAKIASSLSGLDCITQPMLVQYIKDVIGNLDSEKLSQLTDNLGSTIELFREKIRRMLSAYAATQFDKLRDMSEIRTREAHRLPKVINPSPIDRHSISKSLYTEEGSFNDFEAEVIRQVSALGNVEFWHRNLERGKGFYINGNINHYPDFIVRLKSGITVLIETKGDDRDNSDSEEKLRLGKAWETESGKLYRYYMVFDHNDNLDGAITLPELIDRISRL